METIDNDNDTIINKKENADEEDIQEIEFLISNLPLTEDIIIQLLRALNRRKKEYIQHIITVQQFNKGTEKQINEKSTQTETKDGQKNVKLENKNNNDQKNTELDVYLKDNDNDGYVFIAKEKEKGNQITKNNNTIVRSNRNIDNNNINTAVIVDQKNNDNIQCTKKRKLEELIQKSRALNISNINNHLTLQQKNQEKQSIEIEMIADPLQHISKKENDIKSIPDNNMDNHMEKINNALNFDTKNSVDDNDLKYYHKNKRYHDDGQKNDNDEGYYDYEKLQRQFPVHPQYIVISDKNK